MSARSHPRARQERTPRSRLSQQRALIGFAFILPSLLVLVITMLYPILYTATFSVSSVKLPTFETEFIGFENFTRVFSRRDFSAVLKNTTIWVVTGVTLKFVLGFWAALVMNSKLPGIRFLRVVAMLPWTCPIDRRSQSVALDLSKRLRST